jgi:L-2-hydroxyglutarate oxidase LhgO
MGGAMAFAPEPRSSAANGAAVTYGVAIVGGGIVGLATTRELALRYPRLGVVNLEKERAHALHQTGRNSDVVHSGVYYAPGSLRARLCIEGRRALRGYCEERGLRYERVGKVIVALEQRELGRLYDLWERGMRNGVEGLRLIDAAELRAREPHCAGIRALHSPETAIVDYVAIAQRIAQDAREAGAELLLEREVTALRASADAVEVHTPSGAIRARNVIACAGLYGDRVAAMTGGARDPAIVPFRGDYLVLPAAHAPLVRGNIYPVPDPALPFLGVHFTPRLDGSVWLGPNAVLAFAREGYTFGTFSPRDLAQTLAYPGFARLALRYWRTGAAETFRDLVKAAYVRALQRYVPALDARDCLPGPAGVRAQALGSDGRLVDDFVVEAGERVLHVRNAPSPAATASLAIAKNLADRAATAFAL